MKFLQTVLPTRSLKLRSESVRFIHDTLPQSRDERVNYSTAMNQAVLIVKFQFLSKRIDSVAFPLKTKKPNASRKK